MGYNVIMNDNSIMPFGKHKGKKMADVPWGWLIWMYDRKVLSGGVKAYAETTVPILRIQKSQELRVITTVPQHSKYSTGT